MKLIPYGDNIVVQKLKEDRVSKGGIVMPEVGKDGKRNPKVTIIAFGPDAKPDGLEVGDVVITGKWHCEMILIAGQQLGVIKPEGIIGKVVE